MAKPICIETMDKLKLLIGEASSWEEQFDYTYDSGSDDSVDLTCKGTNVDLEIYARHGSSRIELILEDKSGNIIYDKQHNIWQMAYFDYSEIVNLATSVEK